jgi:hypothetical protein
MFDFGYEKNDNNSLFNQIKDSNLINMGTVQNYIPLYTKFFDINQSNYNSFNIRHRYILSSIENRINEHVYSIKIMDKQSKNNNLIKKDTFIKFGGLYDPVKYLCGKYSKKPIINDTFLNCPKLVTDTEINTNTPDYYFNSVYTDSFFSYLSSQLLIEHKFPNALEFYGSFTGIKNKFYFNGYEDFSYIRNYTYFLNNKDKLFKMESDYAEYLLNSDTRCNKKPLSFKTMQSNISIASINELEYDNIFETEKTEKTDNLPNKNDSNIDPLTEKNLVFNYNLTTKSKSSVSTNSTCSSSSSNTQSDDGDMEEGSENSYSSSSCSTNSENKFDIIINEFPCNIIFLEKLDNTLDNLLSDEELSEQELASILCQVVFTLIVYQKCYKFIHNDLHTNNIMYNKTTREFLYYQYNKKVYKIPTFGKIFKIIDFGRSIYTFKGVKCVSDCFSQIGDAATQFNIEPYVNSNKPIIEENFSFDLCRLACSLYDFVISDDEKENINSNVCELVREWTNDDKGRNILYKKNGDERYPEFKLYKMIVRTVHNHLPEEQVEKQVFQQYVTPKKRINKSTKIFNIDDLPDYSV